jgi:hypothetical protein
MKIKSIKSLKKIEFNLIFMAVLAIFFLIPPSDIQSESTKAAQTKHATSGDIELEVEAKKKDPYLAAQEAALTYFQDLRGKLLSVSSNTQKLIIPDTNIINYLNGLYLFCSIKKGTCPAILEVLFEIDLVNSRLSNATVCPVLKGFWKKYLSNDFDDRMKFNTSTGFISKINEFNAKERPKFVRCEETLKEIFKSGSSPSNLFASRYSNNSRTIKALDEVISLINAVSENGTNVFQATGTM